MRPKVVRNASLRLAFYPVRRACSSAIQLALGQDFIAFDDIPDNSPLTRFTCYRNTFDRLRSLYYNFVYPADQGFSSFDLDVPPDNEIPFNAWLLLVAATRDETCNEHLHSQDWHLIAPNLTVYDFSDRQVIFDQVLHAAVPQVGQASPDLRFLKFGPYALSAIQSRYRAEIETFSYSP